MTALFVLNGSTWHQLTEPIRPSEANEWLEHYRRWFPYDAFELRQPYGH